MPSEQVQIIWVVPESETSVLSAEARSVGGTAETPKRWVPDPNTIHKFGDQMEPLMTVALIVSAGWLIQRLSDILLDHIHPQSQLVDMRVVPAVVHPAPYVKPPGTLVVLKREGGEDVEKKYPPERRDEALAVLPKLFS